jgi:hypothetical protein
MGLNLRARCYREYPKGINSARQEWYMDMPFTNLRMESLNRAETICQKGLGPNGTYLREKCHRER